jgi:serine/threonine protein kinase
LGKGAYGVVYKGKEKNGSEWRAIKKIAKKNIKQPELLLNEIEILKSLDHPSCIKLYETFEDENNVFLVTEYSTFHIVSAKAASCSTVWTHRVTFLRRMLVKFLCK